jgi:hypothetical protein
VAAKKDELSMVRYNPPSTIMVPTNRNFPITKAERRNGIEARNQERSLDYQRAISEKTQDVISDINASRFTSFTGAAERMYAIKQAGNRPAELQQYIDHVFAQSLQRMDMHQETAADRGANKVIQIQDASFHTPVAWKQRRFFGSELDDE